MNNRITLLLINLFLFLGCETNINISVQEAHNSLGEENVLFLDVRTREEFVRDGRIKNALLIPVNSLEKKLIELDIHRQKKIIVYCRSGRRSQIATDILIENNFNAFNMEGGFLAWEEYTYP
tara:strand:- start:209 stop:574 length:366 start_codon:yes stop_codon:yes gene_type:complete